MNTIEDLGINSALRLANPEWALRLIKSSKVPDSDKRILLIKTLRSVSRYAKKSKIAIRALFVLFWEFWSIDDLENARLCLHSLSSRELDYEEDRLLFVMSEMFQKRNLQTMCGFCLV